MQSKVVAELEIGSQNSDSKSGTVRTWTYFIQTKAQDKVGIEKPFHWLHNLEFK